MAFSDLPQMAEINTPRSMVADGEYYAYDRFQGLQDSFSQPCNTFACGQICAHQGRDLFNSSHYNLPLRYVDFALWRGFR